MKKLILGVALAGALVAPSLAAEFFIVQDPASKQCQIVAETPSDSSLIILGNGAVFSSREDAEAGLLAFEVCKQM